MNNCVDLGKVNRVELLIPGKIKTSKRTREDEDIKENAIRKEKLPFKKIKISKPKADLFVRKLQNELHFEIVDPIFDGWYRVPMTSLDVAEIDMHASKLRVQSHKDDFITGQRPAPIENHAIIDGHLCVPLYYGVSVFGEGFVDVLPALVKSEKLVNGFIGQLDESMNQVSAHDAIIEKWSGPCKTAYLALPPGYGKTVTALRAICTAGYPALVLCHTKFLVDQWLERAQKFIPEATSVHITSDTLDEAIETSDIGVCTIQSFMLWIKRYNAGTCSKMKALDRFSTLIIDESHHYSAPHFSRALPYLMRKRVLALSGTPDRKDGIHLILQHHIGPVTFVAQRQYTSRVVVRILTPFSKEFQKQFQDMPTSKYIGGTAKLNFSSMIGDLCAHQRRNCMIAAEIVNLAQHGERKILVLGDRVKHLEHIAFLISVYASTLPVGVVSQKTKAAEKNRIQDQCKVILGTYMMYKEALDNATINAVALMTPKSDVWQAISRCMRGNNLQVAPFVLDVYDPYMPFVSMFRTRLALYKKEGYEVQFVNNEAFEEKDEPPVALLNSSAL